MATRSTAGVWPERGGFSSSNKMHTASSLREEEELITEKKFTGDSRGKMCLKAAEKEKKHEFHVIHTRKEQE